MAENNSWTGYEHFCSLKRAVLYTEPTQNCSCLCYCSIVTKREMIRFMVVPPDTSHIFKNYILR